MMPTKHPVIFLNSNFRFASKIVEEHPLNLDNFLETIFAPPPPAPLLSILYMGLICTTLPQRPVPQPVFSAALDPLPVLALAQKVS